MLEVGGNYWHTRGLYSGKYSRSACRFKLLSLVNVSVYSPSSMCTRPSANFICHLHLFHNLSDCTLEWFIPIPSFFYIMLYCRYKMCIIIYPFLAYAFITSEPCPPCSFLNAVFVNLRGLEIQLFLYSLHVSNTGVSRRTVWSRIPIIECPYC